MNKKTKKQKREKKENIYKNRHMSKILDIISLFRGDYTQSLNIREISRKLKLNPQTITNHTKKLISENVLKYEIKGKNKELSLNKENLNTKLLLEMSEQNTALSFCTNNPNIKIILQELIEQAETLIIFGSYANLTQTEESDLDIAILNGKKNEIEKVLKRYSIEINPHFVTFKEFEQILNKNNILAKEIRKNHIILGKTNTILNIFWRLTK